MTPPSLGQAGERARDPRRQHAVSALLTVISIDLALVAIVVLCRACRETLRTEGGVTEWASLVGFAAAAVVAFFRIADMGWRPRILVAFPFMALWGVVEEAGLLKPHWFHLEGERWGQKLGVEEVISLTIEAFGARPGASIIVLLAIGAAVGLILTRRGVRDQLHIVIAQPGIVVAVGGLAMIAAAQILDIGFVGSANARYLEETLELNAAICLVWFALTLAPPLRDSPSSARSR